MLLGQLGDLLDLAEPAGHEHQHRVVGRGLEVALDLGLEVARDRLDPAQHDAGPAPEQRRGPQLGQVVGLGDVVDLDGRARRPRRAGRRGPARARAGGAGRRRRRGGGRGSWRQATERGRPPRAPPPPRCGAAPATTSTSSTGIGRGRRDLDGHRALEVGAADLGADPVERREDVRVGVAVGVVRARPRSARPRPRCGRGTPDRRSPPRGAGRRAARRAAGPLAPARRAASARSSRSRLRRQLGVAGEQRDRVAPGGADDQRALVQFAVGVAVRPARAAGRGPRGGGHRRSRSRAGTGRRPRHLAHRHPGRRSGGVEVVDRAATGSGVGGRHTAPTSARSSTVGRAADVVGVAVGDHEQVEVGRARCARSHRAAVSSSPVSTSTRRPRRPQQERVALSHVDGRDGEAVDGQEARPVNGGSDRQHARHGRDGRGPPRRARSRHGSPPSTPRRTRATTVAGAATEADAAAPCGGVRDGEDAPGRDGRRPRTAPPRRHVDTVATSGRGEGDRRGDDRQRDTRRGSRARSPAAPRRTW